MECFRCNYGKMGGESGLYTLFGLIFSVGQIMIVFKTETSNGGSGSANKQTEVQLTNGVVVILQTSGETGGHLIDPPHMKQRPLRSSCITPAFSFYSYIDISSPPFCIVYLPLISSSHPARSILFFK